MKGKVKSRIGDGERSDKRGSSYDAQPASQLGKQPNPDVPTGVLAATVASCKASLGFDRSVWLEQE